MINVYLCDDNTIILEKYKSLLLQIAKEYEIAINLLTFTSGEQILFRLENAIDEADIIYLDILMGGQDGLSTAKKLREYGCMAEIIFLTSNSEYVFDSFDVSPTHYILKETVTDSRFREIFFKAAILSEKKSKELFSCENSSVKKQIPITQISYFEVRNRIITVHYDSNTFDFYSKMENIENELGKKNFIRVHRSYLVHLPYIEQLNKDSIILITGEVVPVGITYSKNIKISISHYMNLSE